MTAGPAVSRLTSTMPLNTACTRSPANYAGAMVVGLPLRGVRVFKQLSWLEVGSVKVAFSRPAHQQVTHIVGRSIAHQKST
jgi:hypothetical protein